MRITAIHRYFWPDIPPYASILREMTEDWASDGHDVRVLTTQPSYGKGSEMPRRPRAERVGKLLVERLPVLRSSRGPARTLVNFVGFPVLASVRVLTMSRPDVVMCSTAPQVLMGYLVSAAAKVRGSAFVYHCMDLHPEVGAISGEFRNPVVYGLLKRMEIATMTRASRVVVLSEDMKVSIGRRDERLAAKVEVINNFALPDFSGEEADDRVLSSLEAPGTRTRLVFTGNLGRFQGLEELVDVLPEVSPATPVEMVFMGDGKAREGLRCRAERVGRETVHRVTLLPQSSPATARALMRTADAGIVSLVPEIVRYAYPSKTTTYLGEGLPLLVVCEPDSELARTVVEEGLGYAAAPGDRAAIVEALTNLAAEAPREREDRRARLGAYYQRTFATSTILGRWRGLLERLS